MPSDIGRAAAVASAAGLFFWLAGGAVLRREQDVGRLADDLLGIVAKGGGGTGRPACHLAVEVERQDRVVGSAGQDQPQALFALPQLAEGVVGLRDVAAFDEDARHGAIR